MLPLNLVLLPLFFPLQGLQPGASSAQDPTPFGMARGDFDGDGRMDLYVPLSPSGRLFLRQVDGSLTPAEPGTVPAVAGSDALCCDVDGDGDSDLLIWGTDAGHLLRNDGGILRDVTAESGLSHTGGVANSIDWIDFDDDGRRDLILSTERGILVFRNLGQGRFEPFPFELLSAAEERANSPAAAPGHVVSAGAPLDPVTVQPVHPTRTGNATFVPPSAGQPSGRRSLVSGPRPMLPGSTNPLPLVSGGLCAASIRDAMSGACLKASATPTLGMLMPLSSDFFVDAASGYVGLGTTSPETRLQVATGTDVTPAGGGFVQFGTNQFLNIAIDNNELMARNGGSFAPLYLNHEGGNVIVSGSGAGRLGVGTSYPTGRLHVVDSTGGDGSVVLPTGSISPLETLAEAGIANTGLDVSFHSMNGATRAILGSRQLTPPSSGYVVAICSLDAQARQQPGPDSFQFSIETSSLGLSSVDDTVTELSSFEVTNVSWTKTFQMTGTSPRTFFLHAKVIDTSDPKSTAPMGSVTNIQMTLLFFPTAYGSVQAN